MSAMTRSRMRCCRSGGKSRARGPAPDDADRSLELAAARVDSGRGGRGTDQGADRVVGEQVAPDLLPDHVRRSRPEDFPRAAQVVLDLLGPVLAFASVVLRLRE